MGLDIYAGTLTRYYARNWKTSVQQWGEANGVNINIVRNEPDDVQIASPKEILAGVTGWKEQFLAVYGQHITEPLLWNEDNDHCGMKLDGTLRASDKNNTGICDASWHSILREEWKAR